MKWLMFLLLTSMPLLIVSVTSAALTPEEYAAQVVKKDLPRSLQWFAKITSLAVVAPPDQPSVLEVRDLYNSALPATQANRQVGISAKGSIERVLLLLEGTRLFAGFQDAPAEFEESRERMIHVLQLAKDQTDHFKFGENPDSLFTEWKQVGVLDFNLFAAELERTLVEVQRLLTAGEISAPQTELVETGVSAEAGRIEAEADAGSEPQLPSEPSQSFEAARFLSYVEAVEVGRVAPECESATVWGTDLAPRCDSDEAPACDRKYARQCKKLQ